MAKKQRSVRLQGWFLSLIFVKIKQMKDNEPLGYKRTFGCNNE